MDEPATTTKPILPWKVRLTIFLLSALSDASCRSNGTVNRRIFNLVDRKVPPNSNPVDGVSSSDVTVDSTRNLWFRLFVPSSSSAATSLPVVVFFHGGGFAFMHPSSIPYDALCRLFCRTFNAVIVSVGYRLTPEHRFPSQYDDGVDVLKFLDENGDILPESADVSKCFLVGDSAGGNVAHHLLIRVSPERLRRVKIIGLVSIQPYFGGEERTDSEKRLKRAPLISVERTDWYWKLFLPDGSNRDHEAANVSGPNCMDILGVDYPNTLIFVSGFDPLKDWQIRYYEWLRTSGKEARLIEYPKTIHAFYIFPQLPETSQLITEVNDFITKQMSNVN